MKKAITAILMLLVMTPLAWGEDGPRTGYFRKAITPLELLGADGANAIASVFPPDEKLTWQLSVPKNYDPAKPAAVYKAAGVDNTDVVSVANVNRQMPGTGYFEQAIEYLDARPQVSKEAE